MEHKIKDEWFDPKQFASDPDMIKKIAEAYTISYTERVAADWIFKLMDRFEQETAALEAKKYKVPEPDKFGIGRRGVG